MIGRRETSQRLELDLLTLERRLPSFRRVLVFVPAMGVHVEVNRADLLVKLRAMRDEFKFGIALVRVQGREVWVTMPEPAR